MAICEFKNQLGTFEAERGLTGINIYHVDSDEKLRDMLLEDDFGFQAFLDRDMKAVSQEQYHAVDQRGKAWVFVRTMYHTGIVTQIFTTAELYYVGIDIENDEYPRYLFQCPVFHDAKLPHWIDFSMMYPNIDNSHYHHRDDDCGIRLYVFYGRDNGQTHSQWKYRFLLYEDDDIGLRVALQTRFDNRDYVFLRGGDDAKLFNPFINGRNSFQIWLDHDTEFSRQIRIALAQVSIEYSYPIGSSSSDWTVRYVHVKGIDQPLLQYVSKSHDDAYQFVTRVPKSMSLVMRQKLTEMGFNLTSESPTDVNYRIQRC